LRAAQGNVTVALFPYDNRGSVKAGAPLYSCMLGFVLCRKVGKVAEVLPGELEVHHPLHGAQSLRGQAARLELWRPQAAERPVLFAGRAPLFL
jgi:hypothetical protein